MGPILLFSIFKSPIYLKFRLFSLLKKKELHPNARVIFDNELLCMFSWFLKNTSGILAVTNFGGFMQ